MERRTFLKNSVLAAGVAFCVPGTKPVSREGDSGQYAGQMDLLKHAAARCHAWGTDKVRGFTFWRVAEPGKIYPHF